jgi:phage shock protein PspC (stress-responsive transcriptional regulator)
VSAPPPAPPRPSHSGHRAGMGGLVREPDDRKIAGVCSGLADRLGVDVTALRVGLVVLALVTPTVVIAYVVAALVVPERRPDQLRVRAQRVHLGRIPHTVLVIGAIIAVAVVVDDAWWLEPFPAALALIAVGVWLIAQGRDDEKDRDEGLPCPARRLRTVQFRHRRTQRLSTTLRWRAAGRTRTRPSSSTRPSVSPRHRAPDHRASFLPRPRPGGPAAPART